MKRKDAEAMAKAAGSRILSGVSKNLDILVAGPGAGAKAEKAEALGTEVWDEAKFMSAVGSGAAATATTTIKIANKKNLRWVGCQTQGRNPCPAHRACLLDEEHRCRRAFNDVLKVDGVTQLIAIAKEVSGDEDANITTALDAREGISLQLDLRLPFDCFCLT